MLPSTFIRARTGTVCNLVLQSKKKKITTTKNLHAQCYAKRFEHEINFVTRFLSSRKQICFSEAIGGLQRHASASRINIVFSQQKQRTVAWLWSDSKISVCVGKDDIFEKHMLGLKKKKQHLELSVRHFLERQQPPLPGPWPWK